VLARRHRGEATAALEATSGRSGLDDNPDDRLGPLAGPAGLDLADVLRGTSRDPSPRPEKAEGRRLDHTLGRKQVQGDDVSVLAGLFLAHRYRAPSGGASVGPDRHGGVLLLCCRQRGITVVASYAGGAHIHRRDAVGAG